MAGFPEGGNVSEGSGVADCGAVAMLHWQGGVVDGKDGVVAQGMRMQPVAQQCLHPVRAGLLGSHSTLAAEAGALVIAIDQEIEATEERRRVEVERLRDGAGERDNASASASTTDKKESHDNISALMTQYNLNNHSDSSPPGVISAFEVREPQSIHGDPVIHERLTPTMEYVSALAHLTTFGILGVCIRYGLRILFSNIANITAEDSSLLVDLPSNMVGCFFMGWVGVVLKKDIAAFSELLVIGLSTGLMGSITTYASWNQALIFLITKGLWVRSIVGLIIGMELSQMSLLVGMDSAKALRLGLMHIRRDRARRDWQKKWGPSPDNLRRRKISLFIFLATSIILWVAALLLTVIDVNSTIRRRLWLSCVVGPPGVWARWLLARLNGQGIGRNQYLKWLPVGTLLTNVVAATLQAVLGTVLLASPEDASLLCKGLQTGLLGCMSTVSTFVTEIHSLHQGPKRWRAYAYFCIMFVCSYSMGLLVYTLPVLTDHL
ncbi:hypothetical protein KC19_VG253000 [Ceratodon purpureus]|uniref:Uncharacterized protein n=1 Tax=Ceratodon purpureus TaxID=3225 RepID=A0A8T0HTE3_CERPU|nr:hypothetical protein KC19_VG253000 [Ceratodon purpureus]